MDNREQEVAEKLALMRDILHRAPAAAIRLRGNDWFAWATAGADNSLLLTQETGAAEVLVTPTDAVILTDTVEAARLEEEELPGGFRIHADRWMDAAARQDFVQRKTSGRAVLSDRPAGTERPLPEELLRRRLILAPSEQTRYREVCRRANDAIEEVLQAARPDWSECQFAGAAATALLAQRLQPALTLAGGERRMAQYCHPAPTRDKLGSAATLVVCARGFGLYAHLARSIHFSPFTDAQKSLQRRLHRIESMALEAARPGTNLQDLYRQLAAAYRDNGHPQALYANQQGGLAGYQINAITINPTANNAVLRAGMALTLHPFLPGAQAGDTYLVRDDAPPENLTQRGEQSHAPRNVQALARAQG